MNSSKLVDDFSSIIDETPISSSSEVIQLCIEQQKTNCFKDELVICVLFSGEVGNQNIINLASWLSIKNENEFKDIVNAGKGAEAQLAIDGYKIQLNVVFEKDSCVNNFNCLLPGISILVTEKQMSTDDVEFIANKYFGSSMLLYLLTTENSEQVKTEFSIKNFINCKRLLFSQLNSSNSIGKLLSNKESIYQQLHTYASNKSLNSIIQFSGLSLQNQLDELIAKKVILNHEVKKVKERNLSKTNNEWFTTIKSDIQKEVFELDKGIKKRITELLRFGTGKLWKEIEEEAYKFNVFEKVKRTKTTELRLPKEYSYNIKNKIYSKLFKHFIADLISINDFFKKALEETELKAIKNNIQITYSSFEHLTDDDINKILKNAIRFERPYLNHIPKKGGYEYLMAIRRYQIIFFMLFSSFGLSFMRKQTHIMIPATIILLGIGGIAVYSSVTKEREDLMIKETEKARETIKSEAKRMLNESCREWTGLLSDHLKEQLGRFLLNIEKQINKLNQKEELRKNRELIKLSRQLQNVDNKLKEMQRVQSRTDLLKKELIKIEHSVKNINFAL